MQFRGRFHFASCLVVLVPAVVLALESASVGNEETREPMPNPHGDRTQCSACHVPTAKGQGPLRFGGNVLQLCQSCHDGQRATREAHPVGMVAANMARQKIPSDFPLDDGRLACLTCHDIAPDCETKPPMSQSTPNRLRGGRLASPMLFCFCCHAEEDYRPFNSHDQLEGDKVKIDTCLWCHTSAPDVNVRREGEALSTLRRKSSEVCRSCHVVTENHPTGGSHMGATPPREMMWHMSAYEMQSTMRLSFPQLLKYARSTQRAPRSMPLDDRGRITCYTCHNSHERGLWPARNPRAVGAEPKQAVNHRLRAHQGKICVACHEK